MRNSKELWEQLESTKPPPKYFTGVYSVPFRAFTSSMDDMNDGFVKTIIEAYYSGKVVIYRDVFSSDQLAGLKQKAFDWSQRVPSVNGARMVEGIKDCHFEVDSIGKFPNGYETKNRSFYLFRFNGDTLGVFGMCSFLWANLKRLGGFSLDEYAHNSPKDGPIDRVQIMHYPPGTGQLSLHSDPYKNQRMVIGILLSKPGEDYKKGGFYVIDENKDKVWIETQINHGDVYTFYPSLLHGVETIDPDKKAEPDSIDGRWYMALYSPDSHEMKVRATALKAPQE